MIWVHIVQLRNKVLTDSAIAEKAHSQTEKAVEQALDSSNVRQEIEQSVALALVMDQVLWKLNLKKAK